MTPIQPDDEQLWILLDRYLAGEARAHEAEAVRTWLAADPAHAEVLEDLRRIRGVAARRPPVRSAEAVWRAFAPELDVGAQPDAQPSVRGNAEAGSHSVIHGDVRSLRRTPPRGSIRLFPQHRTRGAQLAAAAAVLLVAAGTYPVWQSGRASRLERAATLIAPPRVFTTDRGQRAEIRLTGGTSVIRAADSRLVVPADFDSTSRAVVLPGEAYFDGAHNDRKPFVVRVGQAVVRDVGTRFDVRAYAADTSVRLVVTEGRVQL